MKHKLSLKSLRELDFGRCDEAFQVELKRATEDCIDRPSDKTARKVQLVFDIVPVFDPQCSECDGVEVEVVIASKVPVRRSKRYMMAVQHDGSLVFHADSPDDPNAVGLFDNEEGADDE